jgi:hypothetical protein
MARTCPRRVWRTYGAHWQVSTTNRCVGTECICFDESAHLRLTPSFSGEPIAV